MLLQWLLKRVAHCIVPVVKKIVVVVVDVVAFVAGIMLFGAVTSATSCGSGLQCTQHHASSLGEVAVASARVRCGFAGMRVGEAANSGPVQDLYDSGDNLQVPSCDYASGPGDDCVLKDSPA